MVPPPPRLGYRSGGGKVRRSPGENQMDFGGVLASPRKKPKSLKSNPGREEPDVGQRDSGHRGKCLSKEKRDKVGAGIIQKGRERTGWEWLSSGDRTTLQKVKGGCGGAGVRKTLQYNG